MVARPRRPGTGAKVPPTGSAGHPGGAFVHCGTHLGGPFRFSAAGTTGQKGASWVGGSALWVGSEYSVRWMAGGSVDAERSSPGDDALRLVGELRDLGGRMPPGTVAAELATFGPLLNVIVGGRGGVAAFRDGVLLDEAAYIDAYRRVYEALLADLPGRLALLRLVDLAIAADHRENARLLAAFAMLDPPVGEEPEVLGATRHAAPAAAHAVVKFLLLGAPSVPAAATYLVLRARARS